MLEYWNIGIGKAGIMEYWNIGIMGKEPSSKDRMRFLHFSSRSLPMFHYSIIPVFLLP
jgi:hypothetical protein